MAICITALELGGAETMLLELLRHRPEGVEFRVYSLMSGGRLAPQIEALGVPVVGLGMRRGVVSFSAVRRLTALLREYAPDVMHTWMYHADLIGGLAARRAGVRRILWHIHNADLSPERTKLSTRAVVAVLARLSRSVPTLILCCAESAKADHVRRGYPADKLVVVPNGVDVARFRPRPDVRLRVRQQLGVAEDTFLIGRVASWDPQKDWHGLLRAVRLFGEAGGDARFLLVGREIDDDNADLALLIDAEGVRSRLILAGLRDDVPDLLTALDLFTSSSQGEAFPVSIAEAMATGLVCAVTDAGDSGVVVDGAGLVVSRGDAPALAAAWLELAARPAEEREALGEQARGRVQDNYDVTQIARRVWELYRG